MVVLVTPDEDVRLKEKYREHGDPREYEGQSRPNVLFEAGMAIGTAPSRTILVQLGVTRPFSEIAGRFIIRLDDTVSQCQLLAHQLRQAGCPVNLNGSDWHTAGDFSPP